MTVHSMAELERVLMSKITDAMNEASVLMWKDTQDEVNNFYSQGVPKKYKRTGTLGTTPDATPVTTSGNQASFEVYLHDDYGYSTGSFGMAEVLTNAEAHTAGILGKPHFWENSEKKMGDTFDSTMKKFFS